ncbi:MAG: alpha/beta hydrolase [Anaerolineae bacterium]|nr:alpha/beta hydrolase [Anaerolineae bacterium]
MSNWTEGDVSVNGIRLHYYRTGGEKSAVVMSHGITDNGLCWTHLAKALEANYDVIMVDARGHGQSDKPDEGYSAQDHARDLAGLIEALELDKVSLIGHSMGGAIVGELANMYPDCVSHLILEDPAWFPRNDNRAHEETIKRMDDWAQSVVDRQKLSDEVVEAQVRKDNPQWHDDEIVPWVQAQKRVSPKVMQFGYTASAWWEIVPALTCPTLIISGDPEKGVVISRDLEAEIRALNPKVQIVRLDAGHSVRRDQFEAYVAAVKDFLSQT